jgi:hypothetical protein
MTDDGSRLGGWRRFVWVVAVSIFAAWVPVARGEDTTAALELDDHWAFRPIELVLPPVSAESSIGGIESVASANPIDAFVHDRLARAGMAPSPGADARTLARRMHLVLHGLPPSLEDVERWSSAAGTAGEERLVDELLSSPRFGERLATLWLDVARYSESNGFETNRPRPNAWPYRDWVIRAFNDDFPYERFVRAQIAGDSLEDPEATGFLVAGPYDIVKSPDEELTKMQRADELADFVSATGTSFLALTTGCAKCHDHKFDPIPQTEYYALAAVFAGVEHGDRAIERTPTPESIARAQGLRERIGELESELAASGVRGPVSPRANTEVFEATNARFVRFTILATNSSEPCIDELEIWSRSEDVERNVALRNAGAVARASGTLPGFDIHRLEHVHDGKFGNRWSWISDTSGRGWVEIEFPRIERIERITWARDRQGEFLDRVATAYRIEVADSPGNWRVVASSDDRLPMGVSIDRLAKERPGLDEAAVERARALYSKLSASNAELLRAEQESVALTAWAGQFREPPVIHRLHRGDPLLPLEPVDPGAISRLGELEIPAAAPERERRRALADWIVGPARPLAARVIINRLWQHCFGEGLVSTPNDFGHNGARPTHPELLDWLAAELIEKDWSMKHVVRLIISSRTFRQSAQRDAEALRVDGANRLLWRYSSRRLDSEAIRDGILAVSGVLDTRMGGPGFDVVAAVPGNVYNYDTKESWGPGEWRRSVYGHKIRGEQDGTFSVFDCPDGAQSAPRRPTSTTALQALSLLNSPFILEQAEITARAIERCSDDPRERIRCAFRRFYQRDPELAELTDAVELVSEHGLAALARALFNSNEFLFIP